MNAEERLRAERARDVGLFRYTLIRPAAEASLSKRERGALIRAIAAGEHTGPDGRTVTVGRSTLDRWLKAWKSGGFDALVPAARMVQRRTPAEILDLAVALKREVPARTAAQIVAILTEHGTIAPSARTLHRHFADLGLRHELRPLAGAFGRFEADRPNEIWVGDALHGPTINGRKAMLFAFLDDHTRLLTGYRWVRREDTIRMESALRAGIASRGIPSIAYADNGSPYVDRQFLGTLARLGIRLVHSAPGRPLRDAGRSSGSFAACASSSSSRSAPAVSWTPWNSSTSTSPPGSRPSTTSASTPKPAPRRWPGGTTPGRRS